MNETIPNNFDHLKQDSYTQREWDLMIKSLHQQETKVPEWVYYHFLECVPPIYSKQTGFLVGEPNSHDNEGYAMRLWFYGTSDTAFYGKLVNEKYHIKGVA